METPKRKLLEEFGDEAEKMLDSLCGLGLLERKNSKKSDTEGSLLFLGCLSEALN